MPSMYEYLCLIQVLRPVKEKENMQVSSYIKIEGAWSTKMIQSTL